MKNLNQLGRTLTKRELNVVIGGICKACVKIPGREMSEEQKKECEDCQKKNEYFNY